MLSRCMRRPMSDVKDHNVRLSVSLSESDHARLIQTAKEMDVSLAWVARRAISQWLDAYDRDPEHNLIIRAFKPAFFAEPDE